MSSIKPPLKIVHLADLHLGYRRFARLAASGLNQREADVNAAFAEALDRVIKIKPQAVLIAGDFFHSVRPSNTVLHFAYRQLRHLQQNLRCPIIIIAGNHDTPKRSDLGSPLEILAEIEGVYLAHDKLEVFSFEDLGLSVTCLPHAAIGSLAVSTPRAIDKFPYNILMAHGQVGLEVSDFGGADLDLRKIVIGEWDYIALGHVHVYTQISNTVSYSGSIEHTSANIFSEKDRNKGFLEINFPEGRKTFHSLTTPREISEIEAIDCLGLSPEEVDRRLLSAVEELAGGIAGKIIRASLINLSRSHFLELDHRQIRTWRSEALHFGLEFIPPVVADQIKLTPGKPLKTQLFDFLAERPEGVKKVIEKFWQQIEQEVG